MKKKFWDDFKDIVSEMLAMLVIVVSVLIFICLVIISGGLLVAPVFVALMGGVPLILAILIHIICMFLGIVILVFMVRLERVCWARSTIW